MSVSDLDNASTVGDKRAELTASGDVPQADIRREGAQPDRSVGSPTPKIELTSGGVSRYLQGISTSSCSEIDTLIGDLRVLREKLVGDGDRIERDLVEFATLNQSVIKLTEVVMDSVTHVKAPGRRRERTARHEG